MHIKNRNLFRVTRFILLRLPSLFKFFAKFRKTKIRLLIIKTDAIGDYVLFRNFIEVIKRSEPYENYEIDLLGNACWQEIALTYDKEFVSDFFFITPDELYESPVKITKLGWRLFQRNYETVLLPTFARTFIGDGLAGLCAAKHTIGFEGDTERISLRYKAKTDKFYTQRLLLPTGINFEFERSRFFFEHVLQQRVTINGPFIPVENKTRRGIIISPGAGVSKRSWGVEEFIALVQLIKQHSAQPVYLVGGTAEIPAGDYIAGKLPPGSIDNLIGKTSLPQLIALIGGSVLIIANETSAIHIAAATQTKSICILGGGHFGRFAPYPKSMAHGPICVFEKMECFHCNWNCIFQLTENEPYPCISAVSLEKVWQVTLQLLPQ